MGGFWSRVTGRTEQEATGGQPPSAPGTCTDPLEIAALLERWCAEKVRAELMCGASGAVLYARFAEATEGTVRLDVVGGDDCPTMPLSLCVVTLHVDQLARVFFSSMLGTEARDDKRSVWLQVPRAVAGADGRFTFRVPVDDTSELRVALALGGDLWLDVTPHDLSLTGIRLSLPDDCPLVMSQGTNVRLRLALGEVRVQIDASVRRAAGRSYGLFFGSTVRPRGEIVAPDELIAIVRELEARWLRERGAR